MSAHAAARRALALALLTALMACSDGARVNFANPDAAPIDAVSDAAPPPRFDVSGESRPTDAGDATPRFTACDKVDLLFVIDDSGSMADNQRSLVASFDGFMRGVQSRLSTVQSYHVGVVTTDVYGYNPAACTAIGSLVTRTGGPASSNRTCTPFASGANYLDQSEPDLTAGFRCIGQVGTGGSDDERPMRALLNAVDPRTNAAGACNAGFARRDSLLVMLVITDEDDVTKPCTDIGCTPGGSGGAPDDWYRELVGYRAGLAQNVVALSLIGRRLDNPCGAQVNSRVLGFTHRFGANGFVGDICSDHYDTFFQDALAVIETACRGYVAPP